MIYKKLIVIIWILFKIVIVDNLVEFRLKKVWFFQKMVLLTNTDIEMILRIFFLIFNRINIRFIRYKLISIIYLAAKALLTIKSIEILNKTEFEVVFINENNTTFVLYVVILVKLIIMQISIFKAFKFLS